MLSIICTYYYNKELNRWGFIHCVVLARISLLVQQLLLPWYRPLAPAGHVITWRSLYLRAFGSLTSLLSSLALDYLILGYQLNGFRSIFDASSFLSRHGH